MSPMPGVTDTLAPLMFIAMTVTMLLVVFGAPVLMVLAIRALWYRHVYIGRSAELEKLVWQLHRIASSLESAAAITPPAQTRDVEPQPRPVALSMFGR